MRFLRSTWLLVVLFVYASVWGLLAVYLLQAFTPEQVFSSDALAYHTGAVHIAQHGFYSLDGVHAYSEREPGMSFFLAIIYLIFGTGSVVGLYITQAALHCVASMFFAREIALITNKRTGIVTLLLLLFFPATFHIVFSANRESLALSLFMLFAALLLSDYRRRALWKVTVAGAILGCIILTYIPFLLLPIFLIPLYWFWKMKKTHAAILILLPVLIVSLWAERNYANGGALHPAGSFRTTIMWYARGEQAEQITGLLPARCLWAEYISRDWSGLPKSCSFNYLRHLKWPDGKELGNEKIIEAASKQKILHHLPSYLWFSVFEIVELHLPYVDGWGRIYNMFAAVGSVILYFGCMFAIPRLRSRWMLLLGFIVLYTTLIFILTDATPRYLMPVIFAYAAIAAIGYNWLLSKVFAWRNTVS